MSNKNPITTAADIADLIEFSVNETKPKLRTTRGIGDFFTVRVNRRKFTVIVKEFQKPKQAKK